MIAIDEDRLHDALELLIAEPEDSPCFGMSRGNVALVLHRLDQYQCAESMAAATLEYLNAHECPHPPSWVQFSRTYAESLVKQGRYEESLPAFNTTEQLASKLAEKHAEFAEEIELQKAHAFNMWGIALLFLKRIDEALEVYQVALGIYRKYESWNRTGRAETLTNYALVLEADLNPTSAELALKEALDLALEDNYQDQVFKIFEALIKLESSLVSSEEAYKILSEAAEAAESEGRYSTAFVRRCIHADYAAMLGDHITGEEVVANAIRLETQLDRNDHNPAKLRMTAWWLAKQRGATEDELLKILLEGASLWFQRIAKPLKFGDFFTMSDEMHDHFRLLTQCLVRLSRLEEAVTAFEAGRALAHAVEVDPQYFDRVVATNPFHADEVSLGLLMAARESLGYDEVLVVLTVLPPSLVAFVVSKADVQTIDVPMPDELDERKQLFSDISLIATLLEARAGGNAIPEQIRRLAIEVSNVVGVRVVRGLFPHSRLHDVPWRVLLRESGLPWTRLPCTVEFGVFLRTISTNSRLEAMPAKTCIALGHGYAGVGSTSIDLCDEAREFHRAFGPHASLVLDCKSSEVADALRSDGIVLLSCHGAVLGRDTGTRLTLELYDGRKLADEVFPELVSAEVVILSACESGVYRMAGADFPVGAAPNLLRSGARFCIGTRYRIRAQFAAQFFRDLGPRLAGGTEIAQAIAESSEALENVGADLWRDLACVEIIGGP